MFSVSFLSSPLSSDIVFFIIFYLHAKTGISWREGGGGGIERRFSGNKKHTQKNINSNDKKPVNILQLLMAESLYTDMDMTHHHSPHWAKIEPE